MIRKINIFRFVVGEGGISNRAQKDLIEIHIGTCMHTHANI